MKNDDAAKEATAQIVLNPQLRARVDAYRARCAEQGIHQSRRMVVELAIHAGIAQLEREGGLDGVN